MSAVKTPTAIHEGTGVFNHRALDELLQEYYHRGQPYMMAFLHTALPGDSRFVFNTDFELMVFSTAARRIRQAMPGACVFSLPAPQLCGGQPRRPRGGQRLHRAGRGRAAEPAGS